MTRPDGLHGGVPEVEYHSDAALSQSAAKLLLPPSTPAHFRAAVDGPRVDKPEFDLGHAAHREVLGEGPPLVAVDADDWRSKAAREERDAIRAAGATPLLTKDHNTVHAMADALRRHPWAGPLLTAGAGHAEHSAWWTDPLTGVRMRARFDWLTRLGDDRWMPVDYKTTARLAAKTVFERTAYDYGYDVQDTWYRWAVEAVCGQPAADTPMVFIAQETRPPYLVAVHQLGAEYRALGEDRARRAVGVFCACVESGEWPGYPADEITELEPPPWAR